MDYAGRVCCWGWTSGSGLVARRGTILPAVSTVGESNEAQSLCESKSIKPYQAEPWDERETQDQTDRQGWVSRRLIFRKNAQGRAFSIGEQQDADPNFAPKKSPVFNLAGAWIHEHSRNVRMLAPVLAEAGGQGYV
ncbi:MAG: hypothetical protein NT138_06840 [Planctomycetales bacterium]|nr:hypothetical protein [Planctomycetales bacterium]